MSSISLFDGPYDNRSLFSDHFLTERLPESGAWEAEMAEAREQIQRIYHGAKGSLDEASEAQTEEDFIKPVFEALGWHYDVQLETQRQGRRQVPDYALFTSERAAEEARSMRDDPDAYETRMAAVADAKFWGRPLDSEIGSTEREELTNANPSFQIVNYMTATHREWGLLTNGKRWRLYYAGARSRIDTYYEANLHYLLEAGEEEAFRWFYLFFRAEAFRPDPARGGQTFLENVYQESETYAADLEDRLKGLVFKEVFPLLAEGFLADAGESNPTREDLDALYHGTLRLLYRLLFLLHAEARDLLPRGERGYKSYSLTSIVKEVADKIDDRDALAGTATGLWNDLRSLFQIIDRGDPGLNVPRYNGGLFSSANPANDFFERRDIADQYLAPALDALARTANPDTGGRGFVDYKALDVQQLGSIYEGLLEFRLATDSNGDLVLETDKGERKATGSYYTPHYVVEYITESALGAVLDEREERFRTEMDEIEALRERLPEGSAKLREELKPHREAATGALLGLTVCDPAMGSGHFLVHAVDYLAERIVALLGEYPQNPVKERLDKIRRDLLADLEEQGVEIDAGRLKDTNLLKRLVMKRCIYGVDLNPMAVELAKLSLWLDSFTLGAPLSFLDHHLRCGNALIGARVEAVREDLKTQQGQGEIFGGPFAGLLTATRWMKAVAEKTDATVAEVEESVQRFNHYQEAVAPYKRLLDLYTSEHFANRRARYLLQQFGPQMLDLFREEDARAADERQEQTVEAARAVAEEKRFFHWELEFPEVFFDLRRSTWKENPGFDAVIGNPPYEEPSESERGEAIPELNYFESVARYKEAVGYRLNLYRLFVVRALEITKDGGKQSFIVPLSLLGDKFAHGIREKMLEETWLRKIERFPQKDDASDRVFPEAKLSTCIYVLDNRFPPQEKVVVRSHPGRDIEENSPTFTTQQKNFFEFDKANSSIPGLSQQAWDLVLRLGTGEKFVELGQVAKTWTGEVMINRSFEPYSTSPEDGKEIIRGSHIGLYQLVDPKQGEALFLNREKYLDDHTDSKAAFHHQDERIVYQRYAAIDNYRRLIAAILPEGNFCSHTVGYVTDESHYALRFLLSALNSTLFDWRFNLTSTNNNINGYEVEALPVREIAFETPEAEREAAVEAAIDAYDDARDAGNPALVLDAVDDHLATEPERADVVHDLLAHLAREMTRLHEERQRLDAALDPFKFLDRGTPFIPFSDTFAEAIKYGTPLREAVDPGAVHHDLDGLRLMPDDMGGSAWRLEVQLKKRDPATEWREWQKNGHSITREWAPVYRFERGLPEEKARYYQHAFRVMGDFAEASSFPGGHTRTTQKKLRATGVPRFDTGADLTPLVELSEERAAVQRKIAFTDDLIDQIVYRLYDLTDEEIAVVKDA